MLRGMSRSIFLVNSISLLALYMLVTMTASCGEILAGAAGKASLS